MLCHVLSHLHDDDHYHYVLPPLQPVGIRIGWCLRLPAVTGVIRVTEARTIIELKTGSSSFNLAERDRARRPCAQQVAANKSLRQLELAGRKVHVGAVQALLADAVRSKSKRGSSSNYCCHPRRSALLLTPHMKKPHPLCKFTVILYMTKTLMVPLVHKHHERAAP